MMYCVEVRRCPRERAVNVLTRLFNITMESLAEQWRRSVLLPVFKNKGDVHSLY